MTPQNEKDLVSCLLNNPRQRKVPLLDKKKPKKCDTSSREMRQARLFTPKSVVQKFPDFAARALDSPNKLNDRHWHDYTALGNSMPSAFSAENAERRETSIAGLVRPKGRGRGGKCREGGGGANREMHKFASAATESIRVERVESQAGPGLSDTRAREKPRLSHLEERRKCRRRTSIAALIIQSTMQPRRPYEIFSYAKRGSEMKENTRKNSAR